MSLGGGGGSHEFGEWVRSGKIAVASSSGTGRGRTPLGRGTSQGQLWWARAKGRGPRDSVGCPGHRPPPGLYYEPRLWPVDIALAIRQSDLILVPLLRPDWNSDVLPEPTPCLPASALPVLVLLPEISSNPNPQLHIFKFYPYFKKSHFLCGSFYTLFTNGKKRQLWILSLSVLILVCLVSYAASLGQNFIL